MYIHEQKKILNLDYTFITTLLITCFLGTVSFGMLYSAAGGYITPWALKQGLTFMILVLLMSILRFIKIKLIYKLSYHIYFFCVAALLIAEIVGYTTMGAQRWLKIGVINAQPSELAKLGLILALSKYFHHHFCIEESKIHIIIPIIIVLIPTILVLKQPNLGTALILIMIAASIYFVAGIDKWFFIIPLCTALLSLPIAWNFLHGYQKKRVLIFLNPEEDLLGAGYNIAQSKIAIGAGGLLGKGFVNGSQSQLSFLPEKHTDFIFTLLAEEWGFIGVFFIIILYIILLLICYRVAFNCVHRFGKLIVIGVATMIFLHVFINIGMISGLLPVVGTPIPLLSYGGSNLAAVMFGLGLVLNIDKNTKQNLIKLR